MKKVSAKKLEQARKEELDKTKFDIIIPSFDEDKRQILIDSFVSYYGESKRKELTKRINNTEIVFYYSLDYIIKTFNEFVIENKEDVYQSIFNGAGIDISCGGDKTKQKRMENFFYKAFNINDNNFDSLFYESNFITYYANMVNGKMAHYHIQDRIDALNFYFKGMYRAFNKINPVSEEKFKNLIIKLEDSRKDVLLDLYSSTGDFGSQIALTRNSIIQNMREYIQETLPLLKTNQIDMENIENLNVASLKDLFSNGILYSNSLVYPGVISSFTTFCQDIIDGHDNYNTDLLDNIYKDRITYFNMCGINLPSFSDLTIEDEYAQYLTVANILEIVPAPEIADYIEEQRNIRVANAYQFLHWNNKIDEIDDGALNEIKDYSTLLKNLHCCALRISKDKDDNLKSEPIVFISLDRTNSLDFIHGAIVHEFRHAIEMSQNFPIEVEGGYLQSFGLSSIVTTYKKDSKAFCSFIPDVFSSDEKSAELMNNGSILRNLEENTNERISRNIYHNLRRNGNDLLPEIANNNAILVNDRFFDSQALYTSNNEITDKYFKTFEKNIKNATFNGFDNFIEKVGINNLLTLGELLNEFINNSVVSESPNYHQIFHSDNRHGLNLYEDSLNLGIINSSIIKSNIIVDQMKKHNKTTEEDVANKAIDFILAVNNVDLPDINQDEAEDESDSEEPEDESNEYLSTLLSDSEREKE